MSTQPRAPARVGYLGPAGTFTEEALLASARTGSVEPVPLSSIYEAIAALRRGEVEWAVAPIENALDGSINVTLDLLAEEGVELEIGGEALLRVRHSLIAAGPLELARDRHGADPPPSARTVRAVPTQRASRSAHHRGRLNGRGGTDRHERASAGSGSDRHGARGKHLRRDRDPRRGGGPRGQRNALRLARARRRERRAAARSSPPTGECKTSIVFWGAGAESPGWLVRCLDEFSRRDINLTKIESRPRRERLGHYMFFADLAGRSHDAPVAAAIAGLHALCEQVRILGSYPAAEAPVGHISSES